MFDLGGGQQQKDSAVDVVADVFIDAAHLLDHQRHQLDAVCLKVRLAIAFKAQVHHHSDKKLEGEL